MVYYFVPEDNESPDELNAFGVNKAITEVTQGDIRHLFPLPGKYHFRFKNNIEGKIAWMDLNGDHCSVLTYQNKIIMKVTRISWEFHQRSEPKSHSPEKPVKPVQANVKSFDLLFND